MPEQIENSMVVDYDYHSRNIICFCDQCSGPIYEDDDFYDFDGDIVCYGCIDSYIADHMRCEYGR